MTNVKVQPKNYSKDGKEQRLNSLKHKNVEDARLCYDQPQPSSAVSYYGKQNFKVVTHLPSSAFPSSNFHLFTNCCWQLILSSAVFSTFACHLSDLPLSFIHHPLGLFFLPPAISLPISSIAPSAAWSSGSSQLEWLLTVWLNGSVAQWLCGSVVQWLCGLNFVLLPCILNDGFLVDDDIEVVFTAA